MPRSLALTLVAFALLLAAPALAQASGARSRSPGNGEDGDRQRKATAKDAKDAAKNRCGDPHCKSACGSPTAGRGGPEEERRLHLRPRHQQGQGLRERPQRAQENSARTIASVFSGLS